MNDTLWVVIPVKDFVNAKQRLSGVLSQSERRALSQAMVEDMLQRLQTLSSIAGVLLVSDDPGAELLAFRYGAQVVREQGRKKGLNIAVQQAATYLLERGASHMLVLHGDLPCLQIEDLLALGEGLPAESVLVRLSPDRRGEGTNGLLCSLPPPIAFSYGVGSLRAHRDACRRGAIVCQIMPMASLALDIDTPADLQRLQLRLDAGQLVSGKTAAFLKESRVAERLRQMNLADAEEMLVSAASLTTGIRHAH